MCMILKCIFLITTNHITSWISIYIFSTFCIRINPGSIIPPT